MAKGKKQKLSAEELLEQALVPVNEQPYEVLGNWIWTRLGNLVTTSKEKTDEFTNKDYKYIGLEHMQKDSGIIGFGSPHELKSLKNVFHIGDILYGKLRPYLNKHDIVKFDGVCSTDILVFKVGKLTNSKYLNYFLDTDLFIEYAVSNSKGINLPRVSEGIIMDAIVPLPPLAEQQRIVDRFESLFAKLDQAKELAQNALDSFESRKAAILHKAFSGELTAKWREEHGVGMDSWERKPIKEYVSKLNQGWSPKCEAHPSKSEDMWAVIKTTAIQHMHFNEMENKQLPSNLEPKKQHELQEGDILITRAGPRIRVGVCCLVKKVRPRLLLCDKAYRFSALGDKTIPEFLVYQLNTPSILDEINRMKTGISESGVNLTQEGFLSIEIVMPSLSEQMEVVRLLDGFLEREQRVNELINIIDEIDNMKKAILARAFRGELGTNNPSEESPLELLKEVTQ